MFSSDSRYLNQPTYQVTLLRGGVGGVVPPGQHSGSEVTAVVPVLPNPVPLAGYAPQNEPTRLDLMAVQYFNAPTGFWRLCDANNSMLAGSLGARKLIGIPQGRPT